MPQTDLSHLAMFADDTAIITQNKRFSVVISNLQHYVSLLELWLTDWKIKVNASKSACLMFTRRPRLPVGLTPVKFLANPSPGYMLQNIIKMGRTILLERRQSESVGRRNSRTTFLRSDWPRPFARREVGVEMELGRSENKRPEQRRS
ncbi:hypothetical protein TNCV_2501171 [Trichonephila clavipes]|nr:hypothetical protein TNCV_2501171 [Trichonephila clavipes]